MRFKRTGDEGVLLAFGAAEVVAEVLAHLRVRVADAVLVVLRRDHRERVGLVAIFLEIEPGDLAEYPGEAAVDLGFVTDVGRLEQIAPDFGRWRRRHLFDADHKHDARCTRLDRLDALMHGRRTGGAGVLDARRALETQVGGSLQHQRGGEILRGKAGVEMPEHDLVDVLGGNAGVGQRFVRHAHDQAFDALAGQFTEGCMGPADNRRCHRSLLCRTLVALIAEGVTDNSRGSGSGGFASHIKLRYKA